MADNVVEFDRVELEMYLTTTSSHAELLGRRVRDAVAYALRNSLAEHLDARGRDRTQLLFIERLILDCHIGAAWSDELVGRRFCLALVDELDRARGAAVTICFRDRAEFVAAFLIALTDGSARSKWHFDELDGLRMLPISSALRTVVIDEGDAGRMALARLTDEAARRVLHCLTEADAGRLLAHLLASRPVTATTPAPATLLAAIDSPLTAALAGVPQRRLAWLIALDRMEHGSAGSLAIDTLAWLETLHQAARAGRLNAVLNADLHASTVLARCCAAAALDSAPLGWPDAGCALLIARLREVAPATPRPADVRTEPDRMFCRFGGAWLLLLQLIRLGWWSRWQQSLTTAAPDEAEALAARLALAVTARAVAGADYAAVEADLTLCRAFGLVGDPRAAPWPHGRERRLVRALALPTMTSAHGIGVILGDDDRRRLAWIAPPRGTVVALRFARDAAASNAEPGASLAAARDWWRAHDPLRGDHPALERALRLHALNLLREFASRLPGCADSSPGYLRTQCLTLPASVTANARQIDVHLGRAPLDVLLTLAGLKRSEAALPDGRTLRLHAEPLP